MSSGQPPADPSGLGPRQRAAAAAAAADSTSATSVPLYRRPVVVVIAVVAILLVIVGSVALALGGSSDDTAGSSSESGQTGAASGAPTDTFLVLVPGQTAVDAVATSIGCERAGAALALPEGGTEGTSCRIDGSEVLVVKFADTAALQAYAGAFAQEKVTGSAEGATIAVVLVDENVAESVRGDLDL